MKLSPRFPFFLMLLLLTTGARAQTITYSEPEKKDFDRFTFDVVAKRKLDWVHSTIGYKTVLANSLPYFLYNVRIRQKTYLTAQSIDPEGELNTDSRLKEDVALRDQNNDYIYFPRMARLVDKGELIVPCRRGHTVCLTKLDF